MKKKLSKNCRFLKITFFLLLFSSWWVIRVHSSELSGDHKLHSVLSKGIGSEAQNIAPSMVLPKNTRDELNHESVGKIIDINAKENGLTSIVSIEFTKPIQYTAFKLINPLRLILDFPEMDEGSQNSLMQFDKGIVDSIRPIYFKEVGVLRLEIILKQSAAYQVQKLGKNKIIVHIRASKLASDQKVTKSVQPTNPSIERINKSDKIFIAHKKNLLSRDTCFPMLYGEKEMISLDFHNADVRNLFRVFAEVSGFNIILSPEVQGLVSTRMMDVAWNEAMEIILTNNGLRRECFGSNIVRVVTKKVLQVEEEARIAEKARIVAEKINERNAQNLVTEVVRIDNANITELATSLTHSKSSRKDAQITVDTRTNTLILKDLRQYVNNMIETIKVLDVPTAQVLIEAKIVEISKSFTQELGVQWDLTGELDSKNSNNALIAVSPNSTSGGNFLVDLGQTVSEEAENISDFGLTMGGLSSGFDLNKRLEALEAQGKGRILSSPKVITADNREARIKSGRKIPYQVNSAEGSSIEFIDAELSLNVVPHITSDNKVYMIIDASKNAADFTQLVGTAPTVTTSATHTEILVGNGDTAVLGGIYERTSPEKTKEFPFFSKIPLLGLLFNGDADFDTIAELLVFITPTIIETN